MIFTNLEEYVYSKKSSLCLLTPLKNTGFD